jgi:hypothetical protein
MPTPSRVEPSLREVFSYKTPLGGDIRLLKQTFSPSPECAKQRAPRRISFIAGLHGDELEGLYVCRLLSEYLRRLKNENPLAFLGEIHIYPAVNPQAVGNASRLWPFFATDMNRTFAEKNLDTALPSVAAAALLADIKASSDLAVDIHSSNLRLSEIPQIRIIEGFEETLLPLAKQCGVDLIWIHPMAPVFQSTLGYNLNAGDVPTLVVEAGICLRIHAEYGKRIFRGLVNLMQTSGVLEPMRESRIESPRVVFPDEVGLVQSRRAGFFVPAVALGASIRKGQIVGELFDPHHGYSPQEVSSPHTGLLFTLREHPVVFEGAVLARIAMQPAGAP